MRLSSRSMWVPPRVALLLVVSGLALWLVLARSTPSPTIVSGWPGDAAAAAAAAAPTAGASAAAAGSGVGTAGSEAVAADQPWGPPLGAARVVVTQGYGVGTHAPAARKGGIDLAVDSDGDGRSNPEASMGAPLYATMDGVVEAKANTVPAGNHVWIRNAHYKVGYAHLARFAVETGQQVKRGDVIGYVGSTGRSTGPHLHYHIWRDGVNLNPLLFGALPER